MKLPFLGKKEEKEEVSTQTAPLPNLEYKKAEQEYKREVVIVQSIPILKKIGLLLWMMFDVVLVLSFVIYIGVYLVDGSFRERKMIATIDDNIVLHHQILQSGTAESLEVGEPRVFISGTERYDIYAEVTNPNSNWYATFHYHFSSSQGDTDEDFGFIMPASKTPFIAFYQEYTSRPSSVDLIISDLKWHKINPHQINNIGQWMDDRMVFSVENIQYGLASEIGDRIATSSFDITNKSPYSYWDAKFFLILERNGSEVAVNQIIISGFEAGESRNINVNWFGGAPASGSLQIVPSINFFDSDEYMDLSSVAEVDIRELF